MKFFLVLVITLAIAAHANAKAKKSPSNEKRFSSELSKPHHACKKHEVYGPCGGSICQNTCENPQLTTMCKAPCKPGCGCAKGFIRNTATNQCVHPSQCPKLNVCPVNEVYTDCGTACPLTCANKDSPPLFCTENCIIGCFCAAGYVRNANGVCVLPAACPNVCPKGEIFSDCGAYCQRYCGPIRDCAAPPQDCNPGCVCPTGQIRGDNNVCILESACPSLNVCNVNEVFSDCGANSCQPSCSIKSLAAAGLACRPSCTAGCICADGYFHDDNGVCVLEADCPVSSFCPANEVFDACGANGCQNTCANPTLSTVCKATCIAGCICADGFIRDAFESCVLPTDC